MTTIFTVLAWLTPEWFGHLTMAQKIAASFVAALVATPVLTIALAVGAWGYRLLKPLTSEQRTVVTEQNPPDINTEIRRKLSELSIQIDSKLENLDVRMREAAKPLEAPLPANLRA